MHRYLKRLGLCLLALGALLLAAWVFRAPLLTGLARAWIVDQPLQKADAIILLGGGMETRPFAAAKLYHAGYAPRILLMRPQASPTAQLGITDPETEIARKVLVKEGVADADIVFATDEVTNTYEESKAVRHWAGTNRIKTVIIPTDVFHTRRVRWVFDQQLRGAGIQVIVRAVPVREYKIEDWWQHEPGVLAFQNEVLKCTYYWINY